MSQLTKAARMLAHVMTTRIRLPIWIKRLLIRAVSRSSYARIELENANVSKKIRD